MVDLRWAQGPRDRYQRRLLCLSLDEELGPEASIRLVDALLPDLDWSEWTKEYSTGGKGRPPIHPRLVAGCILHGLMNRIRSSRDLETATRMRLDFQWFLNGMTIDHTTFSTFRNRFGDCLEDLLKELNRKARRLLRELNESEPSKVIAVDGTIMRADSDRNGARTAVTLQKKLEDLESRFAEAMAEMDALDAADAAGAQTAADLEARLEKMKADMEKVERALQVARDRDEAKQAKDGRDARPVRVPVTDPDASVLPNKDGGHAPNYTATAAADTATGMITYCDTADGADEAGAVGPAVESSEECFGEKPETVLADSHFSTGENLEHLEDQGVEMLSPSPAAAPDNPACRADPSAPVDDGQLDVLLKQKGKLPKAFFAYDPEQDLYHCPMGRALPFRRPVTRKGADGTKHKVREYQCVDCSDCPLSGRCLSRKAKRRTVSRDRHEPLREKLAERMGTEEAKQRYARRAPVIEGVFGTIKGAMGIRGFRTRGKERVRSEWRWICTGYSLLRLIRLMASPAGSTGSAGSDRPPARQKGLDTGENRALTASALRMPVSGWQMAA